MDRLKFKITACLNEFLSHEIACDGEEWGQRETLMAARLCFLSGIEGKDRANRLCRSIKPELCIYSTLPVIQLLFLHGDLLERDGKKILEAFLENSQSFYREEANREKSNSFHLISLAGMAAWGVYKKDDSLILQVSEQLERFRLKCMEWDALDEYCSPFYSAFQLAALALLGELLPAAAGETACALENFVWRSILERCHPLLSQLAGPYSRGYTSELCGHPQAVAAALEAVMGEESPFSMERLLWREEYASRLLYHGSLDCMRVQALYFATVNYHCDPSLLLHWKSRSLPCLISSVTHTDASCDISIKKNQDRDTKSDYPCGLVLSQVWMGNRCAIGWSDREYENGMACNSFCLMYEKDSFTRTCFTKMTAGEKKLGQWNTFEGIGMTMSQCNFPDEGRKCVEQTEEGWRILYRPRAFLRKERKIRLILALAEHFGKIDRISCGGEGLAEGDCLCVPSRILIADGHMKFSVTFLGKTGKLRVVRENRFLTLEWEKEELEEKTWELLISEIHTD